MSDLQERQILELLKEKGHASVSDISENIYASESTVRRKLTALQEKGLVMRTHGGAKLSEKSSYLPSFAYRVDLNVNEKKRIALLAVKEISDGDVIFIDGSTTAFYMAHYLSEFSNIKVVTNGIDLLSVLAEQHIPAFSTGGRISEINNAVLVGATTINALTDMHADKVFFSAQCIGKDGNIYDNSEDECEIRRVMMRNSDKSIFLCDSAKIGKSATFRLGNINEMDLVISDKDIREKFITDDLLNIVFPEE